MKELIKFIVICLNIAVGRRYMINNRSGEVHDLVNTHRNCMIDSMTDYRLARRKTVMKLFSDGKHNGCRWCMKKFDTDIKK